MHSERDPIVAIATAPGRGGIGIVRVSGAQLAPLLPELLGAAHAVALQPRRASVARFLGADGVAIDEGIALWFPSPHSYTGEDVLELQGHGGPVVLRLLLARCLEVGQPRGMRIAEPGEFTRRAFLNDRLDLAQAEAVADLIDASTEAAARAATRSLSGEFSQHVQALADALLELRTLVEATLDFPEEEIDFLEAAQAVPRLDGLLAQLDGLLGASRQGALLRDGLSVVLVGAPNVGKSSLLNRLAGEDIALVTPIAGTTRDRIAQAIELHGVPLNVIDTAGVRATDDPVERLGIERTLREVARADVVLHLVDAQSPAADDEVLARVSAALGRHVPLVTIVNKIDLAGLAPRADRDSVQLSALTGAGMDGLRRVLLDIAGWDAAAESGVYLARARPLHALQRAREHVVVAQAHAQRGNRQLELFAEELRLAGRALGEITGEVSADDLLGQIFSRFCIGK
jgi:tRNA modification GTPase